MKITPVRYNFIGNWAFSPSVIEVKDNAFCKNLFGNPASTQSGFATTNPITGVGPINNLFFIGVANTIEGVIISSQSINITSNSIDAISNVLIKLELKMLELNDKEFSFSFISGSLSVDYEIDDFNSENKINSKWLSEKFIDKNFELIEEFKPSEMHVVDLLFYIQKSDNKKLTIQVQPRINSDKNLFFRIIEEGFQTIEGKEVANFFIKLNEEGKNQINKLVYNAK